MAITRQEAVDMSIKKWTALAKGKGNKFAVCGLCKYSLEHTTDTGDATDNAGCKNCPLFPDVCANSLVDDDDKLLEPYPLFWRCNDATPEVAQQILDAIKTRGQAWIEEETK